jgi:methyltransferase (TIGR00027 family)
VSAGQPDSTAARVALWRALHVEADPPPHVLEDRIGLALLAPGDDWRDRGDMDVEFTRPFRASIVARARFIEDLVCAEAGRGVDQYVILGAGLDSFAQRRPASASGLTVFEVDQAATQAWKRRRLAESGFGVPDWLRFAPVDFEVGGWRDALDAAGFDTGKRAVVASTGVSMYLSREANLATLRDVAALAPGSSFVMTFLQPLERADPEVRPGLEMAVRGARASGTPFISFFTPEEIQALARDAGFRQVRHVPAAELAQRYFAGRPDGLRPPDGAEDLLVAVA